VEISNCAVVLATGEAMALKAQRSPAGSDFPGLVTQALWTLPAENRTSRRTHRFTRLVYFGLPSQEYCHAMETFW
jgi:hypothetical protein